MWQRLQVILLIVVIGWPLTAKADDTHQDYDKSDIQKYLDRSNSSIDDYQLSQDELSFVYKSRDFKPIWNFSGEENKKAFSNFINSLEQIITYHGLPLDDYPIKLMHKFELSAEKDSSVKLELLVTDTLLELAHDLHGDSINLNELYPGWTFHRHTVDIPLSLAGAIASNTLNSFMDNLALKNTYYRQLAMDLQIYRDKSSHGEWPTITSGPSLRAKDSGPRIQQLRDRLEAEGYLAASQVKNDIFDGKLENALKLYQQRHGIEPDGHAGAKTIADLNIPITKRIEQIRANLERWRHMPEDWPPDRYVLVNIADATIHIYVDNKYVYTGPVIVGRVDRKTPFIQSVIKSMIINPSWHVPSKILREDILPKLKKDPHYLEKLGFVVSSNDDASQLSHIDWKSLQDNIFDVRLRQAPGNMNSLGRLKFDFENDFSVYMHGTPHQELFKKYDRTLSSGCVRLSNPLQVAEILLADNKESWTTARLETAIADNKTRWVGLNKPMPVYFVYWSVFSDENNQINFRPDTYDYDSFLVKIMDAPLQDTTVNGRP